MDNDIGVHVVAYFVSDIHIVNAKDPKAELFATALDDMAKDATHLLLLGDIFDLWVGSSQYFAKEFSPIVSRIKHMVDKGIEVHYVEGNHDFHLEEFWKDQLGVHVHHSDHDLTLGKIKVRVEHGDFINPDDKAYFVWRKFMRSPFLKTAAAIAPGAFTAWIGENLSRASSLSLS